MTERKALPSGFERHVSARLASVFSVSLFCSLAFISLIAEHFSPLWLIYGTDVLASFFNLLKRAIKTLSLICFEIPNWELWNFYNEAEKRNQARS